jgi:hypothetical protein
LLKFYLRDVLRIKHLDDDLRCRPAATDQNSYCFPLAIALYWRYPKEKARRSIWLFGRRFVSSFQFYRKVLLSGPLAQIMFIQNVAMLSQICLRIGA